MMSTTSVLMCVADASFSAINNARRDWRWAGPSALHDLDQGLRSSVRVCLPRPHSVRCHIMVVEQLTHVRMPAKPQQFLADDHLIAISSNCVYLNLQQETNRLLPKQVKTKPRPWTG